MVNAQQMSFLVKFSIDFLFSNLINKYDIH